MRKLSALIIFILAILTVQTCAQEVYFGKNKVRYKEFYWNYIQTRHFDIYFYEDAYATAKFAATVMEASYVEISNELNYRIQRRIPVFIYNSHNDFQQTNIISSMLSEGVGGFTEVFKSRIAIPFSGSYEDFRHVLHHELTHAVSYDMLYGNSLSSLLSRQRLFNMPLWLAEGFAEYSSRHGWDYESDMYVRDATVNGYLAPPQYLGGFMAYKQGQAMIKYIADRYGEDKLGELFRMGKIHLTMEKVFKAVLGTNEEEFYKDFSREMKRRYWPSLAKRKEADEIGKPLTRAREDGSYYNEMPEFSPDGEKIAIFTDRSDYTEIVLISAKDGKVQEKLVKAQRSADLESLHSYLSGMSFSPDGRSLAFVAKSKGKEAIFLLDVEKKEVYLKKRLDYYNVVSPVWSPDGKKIAFSALDSHKRDLYVYDIESDAIKQITDDRFDDVEPDWLPDSDALIFASDRPHPENPVMDNAGHPYVNTEGAFMPGDFEYGTYNLFRVNIGTEIVSPVDVGPGQNRKPKVAPDGHKIAFVSNRNGIDNIYIGYLDSLRYFAVTDILTGVREISWSPDGDELAYSAFFQGAFDIFMLKELIPQGDSGVLTLTDFASGKYDLLKRPLADLGPPTKTENDAPKNKDLTESEPPDNSDSSDVEQTDGTEETTDDNDEDQTEVVTETGVYDDEFVFVSEADDSILDSVLIDIADDSLFAAPMEEPESFDSIPPMLPSGEYQIHSYKVKFTPDYVGGGFSYDTFFGMRGQSYFVFSDYLGNHQIYLATDLVNTIDQSYIQAYYLNNKKRTNLGAGLFHSKSYYVDNNDFLFSDRFYGLQGFARRPFSTFSRLEFSLSQFFIDRKYYDRNAGDTRENRSSKVTILAASWVFDNVLWGATAPVNGRRMKISIDGGINLFDSDDVDFQSIGFDFRKYWHFRKTFSMAFRIAGGASFGGTPKQYFLGGTTNWIGTRTLDAKVYDVENLYFADVVTPLRGQKYYDLSGDRFGLINWEFRFPLIQYFAMRYPLPIVLGNITGVVFTDIGAAWTGSNNTWDDVKTGFGFGARMDLFGLVLLRYDLAWSTDWETVSDKPTSYFSFGADF